MHEEVQHCCLLGCTDGRDSLRHYMQCPHMFAIISFLLPGTSADPLRRLGLIEPSINSFKSVACMFAAYHALHNQIKSGRILPPSSSDTSTNHADGARLRRTWSVFAECFCAEAGDSRLVCRSFSLPQFIDFLVNHRSQNYEFSAIVDVTSLSQSGTPSLASMNQT